jgi:type IV fimbrial biogenesis protein FimT
MFNLTFRKNGFSLIETMITVAILISIITIAIPSLANLTIRMRVDNEISLLHRMLLLARNSAINNEQYVTVCPLNDDERCTQDWQGEISVFSDLNKNRRYEPDNGDTILTVKTPIKNDDKLQYGKKRNALIYGPTGHLVIWGGNATFKYCPKDHSDKSRGIVVSTSGRAYKTVYNKKQAQDTNRSGQGLICR